LLLLPAGLAAGLSSDLSVLELGDMPLPDIAFPDIDDDTLDGF